MEHHLPRWFQRLKYTVYALLMLNTWLFLQEELSTLNRLFIDGFDKDLLFQAFSATIDTAAWVILLLVFELQTFILPDDAMRGKLKWSLHGLSALCYLAIISACWGYVSEMLYYYEVAPLSISDACSLAGQEWSILMDLDDFVDVTPETCSLLQGELWQVGSGAVVTDLDKLESTQWLAWVDVINAATWILVVLVLEADVQLQLRGAYIRRALLASKISKVLLYGILFLAAVYWGFEGDFLDFWDAFLWLFAFFFIEQNLFVWQQQTELKDLNAAGP
jgi:hypothetical protein